MRRIVALLAFAVAACSGYGADDAVSRPTETTVRASDGPGWLVYASRKGDRVEVLRRPLGRGDAEVLFSYPERVGRGAPVVGVSVDGRLVGYVVGGVELHVRDLETGTDSVLVSGEKRNPPPHLDDVAPQWSVPEMNYLSEAEMAECPECGIRALVGVSFSPSGDWVAFEQGYWEGSNWGFIERATGRYAPSGDAAGRLFWRHPTQIVTVGAFYGEEADARIATLDELPNSRVVPNSERRFMEGSLSSAGDRIVMISGTPASVAKQLGVLSIDSGDFSAIDNEDKKLAAGFAGDGTVVWIERRGLSGVLLRPAAEPVPLPDDLYSFRGITAIGPDQIGFSGARREACTRVAERCEGPTPPFQQRYIVANVRDGSVAWQSPGFNAETSFAGVTA